LAGRFEEVRRIARWATLCDRRVVALFLAAASHSTKPNDLRKAKAIALSYVEDFADSEWTDLLRLDLNRSTPEALARIDQFDAKIGGDPYLDVLRSQCHRAMRNLDAALAAAERAAAATPRIPSAHVNLVETANAVERFDLVRRELLILERDLKQSVRFVETSGNYQRFQQSAEFKAWQNERPSK
jgi:hypothetical protein